MSSISKTKTKLELQCQLFIRSKLVAPPKKSFLDLTNVGLVLIIWDVLLGIPFSLLIAVLNRAVMQYLGYEKLMRCPSGIFASRALMLLVNLWIVCSWRKQLVQEEREETVRAEIKMLDEIIASLEMVLVGVEAKEIEEQLRGGNVRMEDAGAQVLDRQGWLEWNGQKR